MSNVTFKMDALSNILKRRGLDDGGAVQKFIDNEVIKKTEAYAPWKVGVLAKSGQGGAPIGSGVVIFNVPYARVRNKYALKNGLRGPRYFDRMKADHRDDIIRGAARKAGVKSE